MIINDGKPRGQRNSFDQYLDTMDLALARPIAFLPVFSRITGSVTAGLMLSQLRYWTTKKGRNEWIFKTQEEMERETTLTRREQETARRRLVQLRILKVERRGVPARLHYQIDFEALVCHISAYATQLADFSSLAESANLDCTEPPNLLGEKRQTNTETTSEITSETLSPSDSSAALTPEDLIEAWNTQCARFGLPRVKELTAARRRKALLRIREHPDVEFWSDIFYRVRTSSFLLGNRPTNGHEHWTARFDWLIDNDTNIVKVAEGQYDDKAHPKQVYLGR